jgi:hypothetical protein
MPILGQNLISDSTTGTNYSATLKNPLDPINQHTVCNTSTASSLHSIVSVNVFPITAFHKAIFMIYFLTLSSTILKMNCNWMTDNIKNAWKKKSKQCTEYSGSLPQEGNSKARQLPSLYPFVYGKSFDDCKLNTARVPRDHQYLNPEHRKYISAHRKIHR